MTPTEPLVYERTLQSAISLNDNSWVYTVDDLPTLKDDIPTESNEYVIIKLLSFVQTDIRLSFHMQKLNRVLTLAPPSKFCTVSFANFDLRVDTVSRKAEYIEKFLLNGITLNDTVYKCFGWSNSQLKSRTCFLYAFPPGQNAMAILDALGDFKDFNQVGKKSKRIGLLFSEAELGIHLRPDVCRDIPDIEAHGHVFSDGCGLMSRGFAKRLSRSKLIKFHGLPYVPSVVQIRYRGYKGVLMINPERKMDGQVHFRKSMRKFSGCPDDTLSILAYSKPYAFGKLNGELVTLLSALGIPDEIFLRKQKEYFDLILEASDDPITAFRFMSYMGDKHSAEAIVLEGLDSAKTRTALKSAQTAAWAKMFDKRDFERVHIMIPKSRLLLGVCDPTSQLAANECHVRVSIEREGVRSLEGAWVIVGRNPCLHPGDLRKLRVRSVPGFEHLVDCIVFSATGSVPQPSLMSGGDLDGDQFFVCWDMDLIPKTLHEPHPYPPAKERPKHKIDHDDLIKYFAHWNNGSMGRIANLYLRWVRALPEGALSTQCLELNHLYSLSVDGERVNVPKHLLTPPTPKKDERQRQLEAPEPFIVDKLTEQVATLRKTIKFGLQPSIAQLDRETIQFLAASDDICLTEFELFELVNLWAAKNQQSMRQFVHYFDFGSFTADQKAWVRSYGKIDLHPLELEGLLRNALNQSTILTPREIRQSNLGSPELHWRRLYCSQTDGCCLFIPMLTLALEDFTRKLLVVDVAGAVRFRVAILLSKRIQPAEDNDNTLVDDTVLTFPFRPGQSSSRRPFRTVKGYCLGWNGSVFQLFNSARGNTFIWLSKPQNPGQGPLGAVSIDLGRFGREVQTNIARITKNALRGLEIYVLSNRDRVGHEILDISCFMVRTVTIIPRIVNEPKEYVLEGIDDLDWSAYPPVIQDIIKANDWTRLGQLTDTDIEHVGHACCRAQDLERLIELIRWHLGELRPATESHLQSLLKSIPRLCILFPNVSIPNNTWNSFLQSPAFVKSYCVALIQSANLAPGLVTSALTNILEGAPPLSFHDVFSLVSKIPTTVRASDVSLELITLLHDFINKPRDGSSNMPEEEHLMMLVRNVCIDRSAEAEEACPCDTWGVPLQEESEIMIEPFETSQGDVVTARVRVDINVSFRVGDHVRLVSAIPPKNKPLRCPRVLDGLIQAFTLGSLRISLMEPPPPEKCPWYIFPAGNNTTASSMIESVTLLARQGNQACPIFSSLFGREFPDPALSSDVTESHPVCDLGLNASQTRAVRESMKKNLTLIWGPPGTGKTTTIVQIIERWKSTLGDKERILVAASTNNAVDNVLEKYIASKSTPQDIVRVCPDSRLVSKAVIRYWVGAFLEGDFNKPSKHMREAQKKVSEAKVIFTTCSGAALGLLRKIDFPYVIVDEASQLTEPNTLIALAKGCKRAALVGDHVQLRPMVTSLGRAYAHDISLFERLYKEPDRNDIAKVMLDIQYRMNPKIAMFPSMFFYKNKLHSGVTVEDRGLPNTKLDWEGQFVKFVPSENLPKGSESFYHASKSNRSQAEQCVKIISLLRQSSKRTQSSTGGDSKKMSIAVLTPYAAQVKLLRHLEKPVDSETVGSVTVATVDSFQGREADIVIFCTVRCNANCNIGFLADERRMNVAFTRAKRGFIIVGHRNTLVKSKEGGLLWKAWFGSLGEAK